MNILLFSTQCGPPGLLGLSVPIPVEKDFKPKPEYVGEETVQEVHSYLKAVIKFNVLIVSFKNNHYDMGWVF